MQRRALLLALTTTTTATMATLLPGVARAAGPAAPNPDDPTVARLRRGGVVVLMRHATTDPGVGDPPEFEPGVCGTQRNLSAAGRAQSQRIGRWFDDRGLRPAAVRSSEWCRCLDTATLAFGRSGRVVPWTALNSFFGSSQAEPVQTAELRRALAALPKTAPGGFEVWVTHMVNVSALTGDNLAMGSALLIAPPTAGDTAGVTNLGRLDFN